MRLPSSLVLSLLLAAVPWGGRALGAGRCSGVDGRGVRISLPAPPSRIVSLTPANTEILFALGLGRRIVGVTAWCTFPPEARRIARIGDMHTSIEKVLALRPDLIVGSISANRSAVERLSTLPQTRGRLFAADPQSIDGLVTTISSLGDVTGTAAEARRVTSELRRRVVAARATALRGAERPRVLAVFQSDPLWVAGSMNFIDELITLAGGVNVGAAAGTGFVGFSPERAIASRPDIVLAGAVDAASIRKAPAWRSVPAVRRGAIHPVLADDFARPAPRVADSLDALVALFHGRRGR